MARSREEIQAEQQAISARLPQGPTIGIPSASMMADFARLDALQLEMKQLEQETASTIAAEVADTKKTNRRATMLSLQPNSTINSLLLTRNGV